MGDYETENTTFELSDGKPGLGGNEDYWTIEEFYREVAEQPLFLTPGERFEYSNMAYFLLSQVVESVSGKTLREFARDEIFEPLQMEALGSGGFEIYMTNLDWVGEGGVFTTLNDFIKWDTAFMAGDMPGGDEVETLMLEPHPVTVQTMDSDFFDEGAGYGFGLVIGKYQGHRVHDHDGAWVGFLALYTRFPDDNFSIVLLCNRSDAWEDGKVEKLVDLAVSEFSD